MSATDYSPLAYPEGWPQSPTKMERFCRWIPVFGWHIAFNLERARIHPGEEFVESTLAKRSSIPPDIWDDPHRAAIAKEIADLCKQVVGWRSTNFIPDDPFEIMIGWKTGDLSELEVIMQIERMIGTSLDEKRMIEIVHMTFGEVVDFVLSNAPSAVPNSRRQYPRE